MKKTIVCFLSLFTLVCLLLTIAGCGTAEQGETQSSNTGDLGNMTPDIALSTQEGKPSFIYNNENAVWMKSGNLKVTLDGVRLIENRSDFPSEGGFGSDARIVIWPGSKEPDVSYYYPDIFDSEGKIIQGGFLILVDVTFENIDAVGYTKSELGLDSVLGFPDPYTFNVGTLLRVAYLREPETDGAFYRTWEIVYSNGPMNFRIEQGESISMTVGFLIGNAMDGGPVDRTQLELCYKAIEDRFVGLLEFENG